MFVCLYRIHLLIYWLYIHAHSYMNKKLNKSNIYIYIHWPHLQQGERVRGEMKLEAARGSVLEVWELQFGAILVDSESDVRHQQRQAEVTIRPSASAICWHWLFLPSPHPNLAACCSLPFPRLPSCCQAAPPSAAQCCSHRWSCHTIRTQEAWLVKSASYPKILRNQNLFETVWLCAEDLGPRSKHWVVSK